MGPGSRSRLAGTTAEEAAVVRAATRSSRDASSTQHFVEISRGMVGLGTNPPGGQGRMSAVMQSDFVARRPAGSSALAYVVVIDDIAAAEPAWRRLERDGALMTPYQRFDWIAPWQHHIGERSGVRPLIVVGSDAQACRRCCCRSAPAGKGRSIVAEFLGGKHANFNLGLWQRDFAMSADAAALRTSWPYRRGGRRSTRAAQPAGKLGRHCQSVRAPAASAFAEPGLSRRAHPRLRGADAHAHQLLDAQEDA